jgi:methyl-accepting chemotaxis protein
MAMVAMDGQSASERRTNGAHTGRTRFWIVPKLQLRMILWMVLVTSILATVAAWAILLTVWSPLGAEWLFLGDGTDADALFADASIRIFTTTGLLLVVFGAIAFMVGIVISHRVAGPLYRMGILARKVTDGALSERLHIREKDYVHHVLPDFNAMLETVEERILGYEATLAKVDEHLGAVTSVGDAEAEQRLQEALQAIRQAVRV